MQRFLSAAAWALLALTAALAPAALAPAARAADDGALVVEKARLLRKVHPRTSAARDSLDLRATFPDRDALKQFDPSTDVVVVTIGGLAVIATEAPGDAKAFRFRRKRGSLTRWTFATKGPDGDVGKRTLAVNARRGTLRLRCKRAYLRHESLGAAEDVPIAITIGDVTAAATISFDRRSADDWRYRRPPSGGPRPIGPVTWERVASGALSNTPRPGIEIARDGAELAALWASYGSPGAQPAVDFETDMVVFVTASIRGPGLYPPVVRVDSVIGAGSSLRVDWHLEGCEWNLCPGAPIDCPQSTLFQVLRATKADAVGAVQGATLFVCP